MRIPKWFWFVAVAVASIFSTAYALGINEQKRDDRIAHMEELLTQFIYRQNFRMCRVERRLEIEPYETC